MKKILNTVFAASALLLATSCAEDKGTSTEVSYANEDERVDRKHIRDYYGMDTLARMVTQAGAEVPQNGQLATEIVKAYYINDRKLDEVKRMYNFSETTLMGGQTPTQDAMKNPDATSATDQLEQQSMRTVQDSVNEVTGGANTEDARPESKEKPGSKSEKNSSSKKQQKQ
ncbi:hypothetical protein [uncultured Pontibacter sp.]|uniref:hypothetical protein n=1 Tax=uncultured Pontibacter sp. TaxID=453356 RepID=UPI002612FFBB|nr:hypothetical protein [uncultured Pontibacter sp.]